MARPVANRRLFVAAHPPPEHAARLAALLEPLDLPPHRPTPIDRIHLTLLFLGDVPVRRIDATIESVGRAAAGLPATTLRPEALTALPRRGPKRTLVLTTDAPAALLEVHRWLVARLARTPRRDDRWLPHLTLARFAPPIALLADRAIDLPPIPIDAVRLMRSRLRPEGAVHEELACFPLSAG